MKPAAMTGSAPVTTSACRQPSAAATTANAGQGHLADVAGEVVGAERGARARPWKGCRDEARADRMLRAAAQSCQQQTRDHAVERAAQSCQGIADRDLRGSH